MTEPTSKANGLSTVHNALRILNAFTMEQPNKRVSDLAIELGLGKSTVSRLLTTLAAEGFVTKDSESQKYRLGLKILTLNSIITSHLEVRTEARPILRQLVQDTGESAHIAVMEEREVVYLEQIESPHPVRILSYVGRRNPMHCTSSGKVLLAYQSHKRIEEILSSELKEFTPNTVTDPSILREQLAKIHEEEFSYSNCEYLNDVVSLAAPVRDYTRRVVAAVSLIGPKHRLHEGQHPYMKSKVTRAAKEISAKLGYYST